MATDTNIPSPQPSMAGRGSNALRFLDSERQKWAQGLSDEKKEDAAKATGMGLTFGIMKGVNEKPAEDYGQSILRKADNLKIPDAAKPVIREFGEGGLVRRFSRPFLGAGLATYIGSRATKNMLGDDKIYDKKKSPRSEVRGMSPVTGGGAPTSPNLEKDAASWIDEMASFFRSGSKNKNLPDTSDAIEEFGRRQESGDIPPTEALSPKETVDELENLRRDLQLEEAGKAVKNDTGFQMRESFRDFKDRASQYKPDLNLRGALEGAGGAAMLGGAGYFGSVGYKSTQPDIKLTPGQQRSRRVARSGSHPAGPLRNVGQKRQQTARRPRQKQASAVEEKQKCASDLTFGPTYSGQSVRVFPDTLQMSKESAQTKLDDLEAKGGRVKYRGKWYTPDQPVESWRPGKKKAILATKGEGVDKTATIVHYGSSGKDDDFNKADGGSAESAQNPEGLSKTKKSAGPSETERRSWQRAMGVGAGLGALGAGSYAAGEYGDDALRQAKIMTPEGFQRLSEFSNIDPHSQGAQNFMREYMQRGSRVMGEDFVELPLGLGRLSGADTLESVRDFIPDTVRKNVLGRYTQLFAGDAPPDDIRHRHYRSFAEGPAQAAAQIQGDLAATGTIEDSFGTFQRDIGGARNQALKSTLEGGKGFDRRRFVDNLASEFAGRFGVGEEEAKGFAETVEDRMYKSDPEAYQRYFQNAVEGEEWRSANNEQTRILENLYGGTPQEGDDAFSAVQQNLVDKAQSHGVRGIESFEDIKGMSSEEQMNLLNAEGSPEDVFQQYGEMKAYDDFKVKPRTYDSTARKPAQEAMNSVEMSARNFAEEAAPKLKGGGKGLMAVAPLAAAGAYYASNSDSDEGMSKESGSMDDGLDKKEVTVTTSEMGAKQLENLLDRLERLGNVGATRSIEIERDDGRFGWDGDGSAKIYDFETEDLEKSAGFALSQLGQSTSQHDTSSDEKSMSVDVDSEDVSRGTAGLAGAGALMSLSGQAAPRVSAEALQKADRFERETFNTNNPADFTSAYINRGSDLMGSEVLNAFGKRPTAKDTIKTLRTSDAIERVFGDTGDYNKQHYEAFESGPRRALGVLGHETAVGEGPEDNIPAPEGRTRFLGVDFSRLNPFVSSGSENPEWNREIRQVHAGEGLPSYLDNKLQEVAEENSLDLQKRQDAEKAVQKTLQQDDPVINNFTRKVQDYWGDAPKDYKNELFDRARKYENFRKATGRVGLGVGALGALGVAGSELYDQNVKEGMVSRTTKKAKGLTQNSIFMTDLTKLSGGPGSGKSRDSTDTIDELEKSPLITIHKRKKVINHRSPDRKTDVKLDQIKYGAQTTYDIEKLGWMLGHFDEWKGEPIQVAGVDGEYHLMDGHHRFLAAKRLDENTLPAEIWVLDENEVREITGQAKQVGQEKSASKTNRFANLMERIMPSIRKSDEAAGTATGDSPVVNPDREGLSLSENAIQPSTTGRDIGIGIAGGGATGALGVAGLQMANGHDGDIGRIGAMGKHINPGEALGIKQGSAESMGKMAIGGWLGQLGRRTVDGVGSTAVGDAAQRVNLSDLVQRVPPTTSQPNTPGVLPETATQKPTLQEQVYGRPSEDPQVGGSSSAGERSTDGGTMESVMGMSGGSAPNPTGAGGQNAASGDGAEKSMDPAPSSSSSQPEGTSGDGEPNSTNSFADSASPEPISTPSQERKEIGQAITDNLGIGLSLGGAGAASGYALDQMTDRPEKTSAKDPFMEGDKMYSQTNDEMLTIENVDGDMLTVSSGDSTWQEPKNVARFKVEKGHWKPGANKEAAIPGPAAGALIGGAGGAGINYLGQRAKMRNNPDRNSVNPYSSARAAMIGAGAGATGPLLFRQADKLIRNADDTISRAEGVMGDVEETRKAMTESAEEVAETARQARGAVGEAEEAGKAVQDTAGSVQDTADEVQGAAEQMRNNRMWGLFSKESSMRSTVADAFVDWVRRTDSGSPDEFQQFLAKNTAVSDPEVRVRPTKADDDAMNNVHFDGAGNGPEMLEVQANGEGYVLPGVGGEGKQLQYHDRLSGIADDARTRELGSVTPISKTKTVSSGGTQTQFRVPLGRTRVSSTPDRSEVTNGLLAGGALLGGGYAANRKRQGKDVLPQLSSPNSQDKKAAKSATIVLEAEDLGMMQPGFDFSSGLEGQKMDFNFEMPEEVNIETPSVEEPEMNQISADDGAQPKDVETPKPETPDKEIKKPKQMVA